jgi:hypothetical protein
VSDLAAAQEEIPGVFVESSRYIVERRAQIVINGVTVAFEPGRIVTDEVMLARLKESNAPIREITDESDIGTCPHCGRSFSVMAQQGAREILARAAKLGFR